MARSALWVVGVVVTVVLSGCARSRVYYNPYIDDATFLNRQFTVDDGYCTSAAAGSVPIPQVRIYAAEPQSYSFSGQATTYNPYSGYSTTDYSGTAYAYPNAGASFATGFANGMNMGAAMAARRDRDRVYHGCMVALGWTANKNEVAYLRSEYAEKGRQAEERENQIVQDAIESIPELAEWQASDPAKWDLAVSIDKQFRGMPRYADAPLRDRFLDVVKEVKAQSKTTSRKK